MITAIKRQLTLEEFQKCERIKEIIKRKGVWQWCLTMKKNVVIIESLNPFQSITKQNIYRTLLLIYRKYRHFDRVFSNSANNSIIQRHYKDYLNWTNDNYKNSW